MIRKLTRDRSKPVNIEKIEALKEVRGRGLSTELPDPCVCSGFCRQYCGTKPGSDGDMYSGNKIYR